MNGAFWIGLLVLIAGGLATIAAASGTQKPKASSQAKQTEKTAIFAMGCFWCAESDFEKVPGVIKVVSGYTGGQTANPSYEQVSADTTGHYEAVKVTYNPAKVTYGKLLSAFWKNVDPFDAAGQFCDKGSSYRAAIFPNGKGETAAAEASLKHLEGVFKRPLVTKILPAGKFYPAEEYHQDYYKNNPIRYKTYRNGCGRDARLQEIWGAK